MSQSQNQPALTQRNYQIKKLLDAIANYNPTSEQIQSMINARKEMLKNIQKKFKNSHPNSTYRFPLLKSSYSEGQVGYQNQQSPKESIQNLYQQNVNIIPSIQIKNAFPQIQIKKQRIPLEQTTLNLNNLSQNQELRMSLKVKNKNEQKTKGFERSGNKNSNSLTAKIVKKQIILTNQKKRQNYNKQSSNTNSIGSKLKIKKPNIYLNQTKNQVHLRTQNNINFESYYNFSKSKDKQQGLINTQNLMSFSDKFVHQPYDDLIFEEKSEESLFYNSRTNENIDENTNFQYPKQIFNVSGLKQKLRQSSKDLKKAFTKRHKRTLTEGGESQIKIKLFSSSFKKDSQSKFKKNNQSCTRTLFHKVHQKTNSNLEQNALKIKNQQNLMNRTLSTISQSSIRKGIKICSKQNKSYQKSRQRSEIKHYTVVLKGSDKKQSIEKYVKQNKVKECKQNRQGYRQENKSSKINAIMHSLKQVYKNKNKIKNNSRSKYGIKTSIRN